MTVVVVAADDVAVVAKLYVKAMNVHSAVIAIVLLLHYSVIADTRAGLLPDFASAQ